MGLRKILDVGLISGSLFLSSCGGDDGVKPPIESPVTQPTNRAPQITSTCPTQIKEDNLYQCQVQATDPDGDVINFRMIQGPEWLNFASNSLFGRAPEISEDQSYNVEFQVRDAKGLGTNQSFDLMVQNVPETRILDPETSTLSQVNDDSLVFDEPVFNLSLGDIIVSDTSSYAPYGFLREVISISSDSKTFQTKQSTLEEALGEGSFSFREILSPLDSPKINGPEGISMASPAPGFNFGFNLEDVVLYDRDGNPLTTDDQIVVNGNFSFNADLEIDIDISPLLKLEYFLSKITMEENSELTLTSGLDGNFLSEEVKVGETINLPRFTLYTPSGFPIPIKPEIEFYAGINAGLAKPLEVKISQEVALEEGVIYNGEFNTIFDFSNTFDFNVGENSGDSNLKPFIRPNINLLAYGIGGPSLALSAGLKFESEDNKKSLHGTLGFLFGADLEVFGRDIPGSPYLTNLPEHEELLWEEEIIPPPSTPEGKILFVSDRTGNDDIWMMDTNGSNLFQLTKHSAQDYGPAWSPNGEKLAFVSERDGYSDIYTMNIDGSNLQRLTFESSPFHTNFGPSWSPDGSQIVFAYDSEIYLMNADGTNRIRVDTPYDGLNENPNWSPDGSQIVFETLGGGGGFLHIQKINIDGTGLEALTTASGSVNVYPVWSPDGRQISFGSEISLGATSDIFIMNSDGSNKTNLSNTVYGRNNIRSSWAPDGSHIVYDEVVGSIPNTVSSIWIMDANGDNKILLNENIYYSDWSPRWSPF